MKQTETYSEMRARHGEERARLGSQEALNQKAFNMDCRHAEEIRDAILDPEGDTEFVVSALLSNLADTEYCVGQDCESVWRALDLLPHEVEGNMRLQLCFDLAVCRYWRKRERWEASLDRQRLEKALTECISRPGCYALANDTKEALRRRLAAINAVVEEALLGVAR